MIIKPTIVQTNCMNIQIHIFFSDVMDSLDDDDFQSHKTDEVSVSVTNNA